jgi:hypothetical protein
MTLRANAVMATIFLLLAMTGCTTPAPAPSSAVCEGEGCNGKDPVEIHCDADALSVTQKEGVYVKDGDLEAVLEIRKAKPSVCNQIFWARLTPAPNNKGGYELTLELNGKRSDVQKSEPQNPEVPAWSTVFYAKKGDKLRACVVSVETRHETCTPVVEVV